jgi:Glycosyltransferase family 87
VTTPPEPPGSSSRRLRIASLVAWGTLAVLAAVCVTDLVDRMRRPQGNDLSVYLAAARALVAGGDPYAVPLPQGFSLYPLTIATLLVPLTWVPGVVAQFGWFALNVAALLGALATLDRLWVPGTGALDVRRHLHFVIRLAVVAGALFFPLHRHLMLGQVDLIVLFLCCRFLRADLADRRLAAGMWLGGAIAVKLMPVIFSVPLLRARKGRILFLTGAFVVVWTLALPALASSRVLTLYRDSWWPGLSMEVAAPVTSRWAGRFTLAGALASFWPVLATLPGFRYAAAVLVLLPIAWASGHVGEWRHGRLLVFALCLVAMPLISPLSGGHRLVVVVGALWIWLLAAARWPTHWPDVAGSALFLVANWQGASGRSGGFAVVALLVLYVLLLVKAACPTSARMQVASGCA